jgi:hypothetical protein
MHVKLQNKFHKNDIELNFSQLLVNKIVTNNVSEQNVFLFFIARKFILTV